MLLPVAQILQPGFGIVIEPLSSLRAPAQMGVEKSNADGFDDLRLGFARGRAFAAGRGACAAGVVSACVCACASTAHAARVAALAAALSTLAALLTA